MSPVPEGHRVPPLMETKRRGWLQGLGTGFPQGNQRPVSGEFQLRKKGSFADAVKIDLISLSCTLEGREDAVSHFVYFAHHF